MYSGVSQLGLYLEGWLMVQSLGFYPSLTQPFSSSRPLSCMVRIWLAKCWYLPTLYAQAPIPHSSQAPHSVSTLCIILRPRCSMGRKNRAGKRHALPSEVCLGCSCSGAEHSEAGYSRWAVLLTLLAPLPLGWGWPLEGRVDALEHGVRGGGLLSRSKGSSYFWTL